MKRGSNAKRKLPIRLILGWFLFITLLLSIGFSAVMAGITPVSSEPMEEGQRLRSDYILMLVQCLLGLVVMFLPALLERKLRISIPNYMCVMYFVFLYCAIYLGEVHSFYYLIPQWDTFLHGFSAMMLGTLGFSLVSILNDSERTRMRLSPLFVGMFAFCFAVAVGVVWEFYEFGFDGLLGMNMQKFRLENGVQLVGREALADTMEDLITDAAGALIVAVAGALSISRRRARAEKQAPAPEEGQGAEA